MRRTLLLLAVLPLGAAPGLLAPRELPHLGGSPFPVFVQGFGRGGTVVGVTRKPGVGDVPFAWTSAAGMVAIGTVPGVATGANGLGQVVGYTQAENEPVKGFLWTPSGPLAVISSPLANAVYPKVVNNGGQVAGEMDAVNGERHAFLWTAAGGFKDLGGLGGSQLTVTDITENGLVIGHGQTGSSSDDLAFLWKSGGPIKPLGTLGGSFSYATAANDEGTIVGYSRNAAGNTRAFSYSKGKMTELPAATMDSAAYGINAGGTIVGSGMQFGGRQAFVWPPGGEPLAIADEGLAVDVNDAGTVALYTITGSPSMSHAYLWTLAGGLVDVGSEHDLGSEPLGVTSDGRLVGRRIDHSEVTKAFVGTSPADRAYLGGLGGGFSRALHVNAAGQVAGVSRDVLGYDRAVLWTPGDDEAFEVPTPVGHSSPAALNALGQIAGSTFLLSGHTVTAGPSFFWAGPGNAGIEDLGQVNVVDLNNAGQVLVQANPDIAYVWAAGGITPIPPIGEGRIIPSDINNLGQVVGDFDVTAFVRHAFSWTPGAAPVDLGTLGGTHSNAVAVNDAGQIAGTSFLPGDANQHAFRTTQGRRMIDLGSVFGAAGKSEAAAINKNGVVIGSTSSDGSVFHAFLYDNKMRDLGDLGGPELKPWAINDLKDVVGWRNGDNGPQAFVCLAGGPMTDLEAVAGQESSQAFAINDAGEAVGNVLLPDGQRVAVVWRVR